MHRHELARVTDPTGAIADALLVPPSAYAAVLRSDFPYDTTAMVATDLLGAGLAKELDTAHDAMKVLTALSKYAETVSEAHPGERAAFAVYLGGILGSVLGITQANPNTQQKVGS